MEILQDERIQKQSYLREEIINKNYDTKDFLNYCKSKKLNGENIDEWTLIELKNIVQQFQSEKVQPEKELENQTITEEEEQDGLQSNILSSSLTQSTIQSNQNIEQNIQKAYEFQEQEEIIKVQEMNFPMFNLSEDFEVRIISYEFKKGGFFYSDQLIYNIQTNPFQYLVKRSAADIIWYYKQLQKSFPDFYLPYLNVKKLQNENFAKYKIDKTINEVQSFFKELKYCWELRNTEISHQFLSQKEKKVFQKYKNNIKIKHYDKYIEKLKNLETINGSTKCQINQDIDYYFNAYPEYQERKLKEYQKINKLNKQFKLQLNEMSKTMSDMVISVRTLSSLNKEFQQFDDQINICQDSKYVDSLEAQESIFYYLNVINQEYKSYYKRESINLINIKKFIQKRDQIQKKYYKMKLNLLQKKEKLFFQQDEYRWGLDKTEIKDINMENLKIDKQKAFEFMLKDESNKLMEVQLWYGHLNYHFKEQIDTHMHISNQNYLSNKNDIFLLIKQLNYLNINKIELLDDQKAQVNEKLTEYKCNKMAKHFNNQQEQTIILI